MPPTITTSPHCDTLLVMERRQKRLAALAVALVVVAGAARAYRVHARNAARAELEAQRSSARAVSAEARAKIDAVARALDAATVRVEAAKLEAARATNDADRAAAMKRLADAETARHALDVQLAALEGRPAHVRSSRVGCGCDAGDPVCSML